MMDKQPIYEQLVDFFQSLTNQVMELVPRLLIGILVIVIGLLLARIIEKLICRVILYLGNTLNSRLRNQLLSVDLHGSAKFISKTVFWIIILFVTAVVTQIFGIPVLTGWLSGLLDYLPNILAAVIIIFSGIVIGRLLGDLMASAVVKAGVSKGDHIRKLVQFIVIFISSVIAINQIGIDIQFLTNLITIIVAALLFGASLAFGLGARTSVSNILGSYYLQKTYQEGNTVRVGDIVGVIVKITPTSVYLKTKTGQVAIPAKDFNEEKTVLLEEE
ncbi:MAG: hypothetical protein DHS20C17_24650 [Cyclobacteriaceae bacterium]|nr:MAG: hypothetical protein DHS20C17_24650 [Cyclobacteriaceae bacterium]